MVEQYNTTKFGFCKEALKSLKKLKMSKIMYELTLWFICEFFTICQQYKNANFGNFVLAVLFEIKKTS